MARLLLLLHELYQWPPARVQKWYYHQQNVRDSKSSRMLASAWIVSKCMVLYKQSVVSAALSIYSECIQQRDAVSQYTSQ
jgi:hypothetical protein